MEESPRLVTAGYGLHRSQWVKVFVELNILLFFNFKFVHLVNRVIGFSDTDKGKLDEKEMIFGIVTRIDLLNFITLNQNERTVQNGDDLH